MEQYKLKQWYPSLCDDIEVGTIVDYEDGWIYYTNKRGNKTVIEMDEWELSFKNFWELIEEKEPLFVAGDGAIFFDDSYYLVTKPYFVKTKLKAKENIYKRAGFIYFKHESNADEYILWNKPLLNLKDIDEAIEMYSHEFDELKKLAKEKIEQ